MPNKVYKFGIDLFLLKWDYLPTPFSFFVYMIVIVIEVFNIILLLSDNILYKGTNIYLFYYSFEFFLEHSSFYYFFLQEFFKY